MLKYWNSKLSDQESRKVHSLEDTQRQANKQLTSKEDLNFVRKEDNEVEANKEEQRPDHDALASVLVDHDTVCLQSY